MEIGDSPEEAAFRAEARAWLRTVAKPRGEGDNAWRRFRARTAEEDAAQIDAARAWQRTKLDAGWAGIHWPVEHGGQGKSGILAGIFSEEESRFDVPANFFMIGVDMAGPTLMAHGSAAQQEQLLGPMLRGDELWCQLFSEPGAGSDLASLGTRAERDGDGWVVTGQKVWTSSAHIADRGMLLARTDPDAPKQAGITYFVVDMHSPGVDVRPLRQIDGAHHFNEVFLDGVRVPDDARVGAVGEGWKVARTTLTSERTAIGSGTSIKATDILDLARRLGCTGDPLLRQELMKVHTRSELQRWLVARLRTAVSKGVAPGPEASVLKLLNNAQVEHVGSLLETMLGARGTLWHDPESPDGGFWQDVFLFQWSSRIGGGTDQVQRGIIGERVLGLPREPDPYRGAPWRDLPR